MEPVKHKARRALRWSEKYFKTDMVYVAKSGFWMTFGQVSAVGLVFVTAIVFANFLPKEVYGKYKFILSAVAILGGLSLTGLGSVVIQAVAQGKEGVLKDAIRTSVRWGIMPFSVALVLAGYYFFSGNNELGFAMIIGGICTPIVNAYGLYGGLFSGRKDFFRSTMYATVSQTINTVLLLIVSVFVYNALALVAVTFITSVLVTIGLYNHAMNRHKPNGVHDPSMIEYGKHISYMNFLGVVANQLDKVLVFHWLGAVELAVYSFAIAIPEQVIGSFKNLFGIALPKMSVLHPDQLRASVIDKFLRLTLITAGITALYYVAAPYIYLILFPKYLESVWYSQVYMLGLVTIPGISLFSTYFQVRRETAILYKLSVAGNVVTIIYSAFLIYSFGLAGAVIENGASWLTMLLINGYYFAKDGRKLASD